MSSVDIVVPVYSRLDLLVDALLSIPNACKENDWKVFVVNDNSPEGLSEIKNILKDFEEYDITLLHNGQNGGFAYSVNRGAGRGRGKYVFVLSTDVVLFENAIDNAISEIENDESIGAVGMKLLFPEGTPNGTPGHIQHVGISFDIHRMPHHIFINWTPDNPKVLGIREVPAITGAAFLVPRAIWRNIKGLDTEYGIGTYEDMDMCFKIRSMDKKIIVCQESMGTHFVGASIKEANGSFPLDHNRQIFYNKWKPYIVWDDGALL